MLKGKFQERTVELIWSQEPSIKYTSVLDPICLGTKHLNSVLVVYSSSCNVRLWICLLLILSKQLVFHYFVINLVRTLKKTCCGNTMQINMYCIEGLFFIFVYRDIQGKQNTMPKLNISWRTRKVDKVIFWNNFPFLVFFWDLSISVVSVGIVM